MTRVQPFQMTAEVLAAMALKQIAQASPDLCPGCRFFFSDYKISTPPSLDESKRFTFSGKGLLNRIREEDGDVLLPKEHSFTITAQLGKDHQGLPEVTVQSIILE
jgi:hypothetical protein